MLSIKPVKGSYPLIEDMVLFSGLRRGVCIYMYIYMATLFRGDQGHIRRYVGMHFGCEVPRYSYVFPILGLVLVFG